jgi:hypothetical protein
MLLTGEDFLGVKEDSIEIIENFYSILREKFKLRKKISSFLLLPGSA